jgi:hypothetical protein
MTFSSLAPNIALMREQETTFLAEFTDNALETLYLDAAKNDLLLDLCAALGLGADAADDLAALDTYIDLHQTLMTGTLTIALLVKHFQNAPGTEWNVEKYDRWSKRYTERKRGFPALPTVSGTAHAYSFPIVK